MISVALAALIVTQIAPGGDTTPKDLTAEKVFGSPETPPPDGWVKSLTIGANGAFTRSTNVVGTINGTSAQAGIIIEGGATLVSGLNRWENAVKLTESFTRTPLVGTFLKSADELRLQSTILHKLQAVQWLGPYARFLGTTSIFPGYQAYGSDQGIIKTSAGDGGQTFPAELIPAGQRLTLTKPFEPTLLRQSIGMFANPINSQPVTFKSRLGGALQEIITRRGYALADSGGTPEIEFNQLSGSIQGGAELDLEALGTIVTNVTYSARASFFVPVVQSGVDDDAPKAFDAMTTDIAAKLSVHLAKWLSLDYVLSAKRVPQIVEEWQIQNGLLLSVAYSVIEPQ